jgi:hypothetical protein
VIIHTRDEPSVAATGNPQVPSSTKQKSTAKDPTLMLIWQAVVESIQISTLIGRIIIDDTIKIMIFLFFYFVSMMKINNFTPVNGCNSVLIWVL